MWWLVEVRVSFCDYWVEKMVSLCFFLFTKISLCWILPALFHPAFVVMGGGGCVALMGMIGFRVCFADFIII